MDVYAYALTNSNARLTDFGETMKYAAPVAKAYGATLDETAAMVMMMANAGIKGSMAGTSLRMGLLRLAGPPKTATKEMQKLGLSLSDAQAGALEADAVLKGLGIDLDGAVTPGEKMTRVLMQLHDKTKNLSQDEKLATFKGIFGVNAETGWLALFDQGPEVFAKYVAGLRNADGYSKQVATTMMDNTEGALKYLSSAWDGVQESVGKAFTPMVRSAAEAITPILSSFSQWAAQNPAIIQGIVGIGAALAGVVVLATGVAVAFAGWSFITAQIGMFTAGMAAVRGGMLATEVASLGMASRMGAAFATMRATVTAGIASMGAVTWTGLFTGLSAQLAAATAAVSRFFTTLTLGSVASTAAAGLGKIGAAFTAVGHAAKALALSPVFAALMLLAAAAYVIYTNWDKISPAISRVGAAFSSALSAASAACSNLVAALGPIGSAISNAFSNMDTGFADTIVITFLAIVNVIAGVCTSIINIFSATVNTIAHMFDGLGGVISAAMDFDFDTMGARAFDLSNKIKSDWSKINFSKLDFGYDIGGEISKQKEIYYAEKYSKLQAPEHAPQNFSPLMAAAQTLNPNPQPVQAPAPTEVKVEMPKEMQSAIAQTVMQYQKSPETVTPEIQKAMVQAMNQYQMPAELQSALAQYKMPAEMQSAMMTNQTPNQTPAPLPVETPAPSQPIDTAPLQTAINEVGQSIGQTLSQFPQSLQPVQESLSQFPQSLQPVQETLSQFPQSLQPVQESLSQFPQSLQPVQESLSQFPQSLQPVQESLMQMSSAVTEMQSGFTAVSSALTELSTQLSSASSALQAFSTALQATLSALSAFTAALMATLGGLTALSTAASGAAGSVSSLGSAASSAASALSSAASSIAAAASSAASAAASASAAAASAGSAKANYRGGIYGKGAFLTWFAERSPEAAIPLDKSARAINLWTQAGQILGVLPSERSITFSTPSPNSKLGNFQNQQFQTRKLTLSSLKTAQNLQNQQFQTRKSTSSSITFLSNNDLENEYMKYAKGRAEFTGGAI